MSRTTTTPGWQGWPGVTGQKEEKKENEKEEKEKMKEEKKFSHTGQAKVVQEVLVDLKIWLLDGRSGYPFDFHFY